MPSQQSFWSLYLDGTAQTSHEPRILGVLNLIVRRQVVFRDISGRRTTYGHSIEVARTSTDLSLTLLLQPAGSSVSIEDALAGLGVDRWSQSSFAMQILSAANNFSSLHPRGFRMTATLDLTVFDLPEGEDLVMPEAVEQLGSEPGRVARGASKPAILGLKDKVHAAQDRECCSICLEDFHCGEKVTELSCSHVFHGPCIVPWLEGTNSCPLCRCELDT